MEIRLANNNDVESLLKLLYQVQKIHSDVRPDLFIKGTTKYNDNELLEIINDNKKPIFVALEDNIIVGYAFCIVSTPISNTLQKIKTLYIDDLCVDSNYRRRKIGLSLYNYVLNYAKSIGCYNVTLNVWYDNKEALAFYQKIGLKIQKLGMEKIL